jgi:putative transcriptional regulator
MTINHHPDEEMLAAYAAGALDLGQHVAIATHLASCATCRGFVRACESVGGAMLEDATLEDGAPAALAAGALQRALNRLDGATPAAAARTRPAALAEDLPPGLPGFVKGYAFGPWRWVAPSIHVRAIALPEPSPTRVLLLRSAPGTRLVHHEHTGVELTCVLTGAFAHEGGRYGPGDFDLGDPSVEHEPHIEAGPPCICLVAMQGDLKLTGLIGRMMQPFVRL